MIASFAVLMLHRSSLRYAMRVVQTFLSHDTFSRNTGNQFKQVFEALRELMRSPEPANRVVEPPDTTRRLRGQEARLDAQASHRPRIRIASRREVEWVSSCVDGTA